MTTQSHMAAMRSKVNGVNKLWLLCTWLLTLGSAWLCSTPRHLTGIWCFNVACCIFSFQARRALRQNLPREGWIRKCRRAGRRRVKRHRRNQKPKHSWWTWLAHLRSIQTNADGWWTTRFHRFCSMPWWPIRPQAFCRCRRSSTYQAYSTTQSHMAGMRSKVNVVNTLWLLSTWLLTLSSAWLCSTPRHLTVIWCFNMACCVFSFQARRALRSCLPRDGWIRKCRKVGQRRVKPQRRQQRRNRGWLTSLEHLCDIHRNIYGSWIARFHQFCSMPRWPIRPPRFSGGGPRPEDKAFLVGLLVSVLGDEAWVAQMMEEDWVETWKGWKDMAEKGTDAVAMECVDRFLEIVGANVPFRMQSDADRIEELQAQGLLLQTAESHGVNNCLIDSLLLALTAEGLTPQGKIFSKAERRQLCSRCRSHLRRQHGTPEGTYLDGHSSAPHILDYFLRQVWRRDVSVRVHFYDRLAATDLLDNPDEVAFVDYTVGTKLIYERSHLHVYNHTSRLGRGYHFDALIPQEVLGRSTNRSAGSTDPIPDAATPSHADHPAVEPPNTSTAKPADGPAGGRQDPEPTPNQPEALPEALPLEQPPENQPEPWPQDPAEDEALSDVGSADTDSLLSWNSHASTEGSSAVVSVTVEPERTWTTFEDAQAEELRQLSAHFKARPLLPPPLECDLSPKHTDSMSGIVFPASHCAFAGCNWCSDAQPCMDGLHSETQWLVEGTNWRCTSGTCCGNAQTCLWAHLSSQHGAAFRGCPGDIPSAYVAALQQIEEETVPAVGWSVDRRTLRRLHEERREEHCIALICSCCAAVLPSGPRSDIGYLTIQNIFSSITTKSFSENWDLTNYRSTYGLHASIRDRLHGPEWQRRLPDSLFQGKSILCCPEDHRCQSCNIPPRETTSALGRLELGSSAARRPQGFAQGDPTDRFCENCELPLCRSCWKRMRQQTFAGVPQALTNDNWYGYPLELLYSHKVRWAEAAAACPVWTSLVCFYVEADRGHILEEALHRADHRIAIRGNVSAVSLPWEQVYGKLSALTAQDNIATLPHAKPALQAMIHLTVKGMKHGEIADWLVGARVRPWIVVTLLDHLVDLQHPMFRGYDGTPAELKTHFRSKVNQLYGTEEVNLVSVEDVQEMPPAPAESLPPQKKNATPEPAGLQSFTGEAFGGNVRPQVLSGDWSTSQTTDLTAQEVTRLAVGTPQVTVRTGHEFWDQWQTKYLSWAFPFSLPAPVGGPDFPNQDRWRRNTEAPMLGPIAHLRSLTRRVESSIRNSWDLVSGLRRLTFKWHSVWNTPLWRKQKGKTDLLETTPMHEWVQAAKALYQKLQKGTYRTASNYLKPINYDARKLWFATNLTEPEIQLLRDIRQTQLLLPGTVEVRRRIGRFLFGARVELGEPIFMTLSPTTRHNAVCLKMSRYRANDPGADDCFARDHPAVWDQADVIIPLPDYETRRQTTVRDPWSVDIAFQSMVRFVFSELLGIRMCFRCPSCSCRDTLGQSAQPVGGILGLVLGFCGAIEYQQNSTPHFHANVFVASIWQQPLTVLARKLQQKAVSLQEIYQYQAWLHNESHVHLEDHEALVPDLEKAWKQNFLEQKHDKLCLWPAFVAGDTTPSPWTSGSFQAEVACDDAENYKLLYTKALQTKLSHQQHHIHLWDPKHKCSVPLPGCCKKNAPNKCKHGFPKPLCDVARVICRGNARKYRLSTAGRRNALGCVLNPRNSEWLSGTMHAFAIMFLGNSHTGVNYRVPLLEETHDPTCSRNCLAHGTLSRLQRLMQVAARKATKYFTGYLQKPQPLGKNELQQAAKHLSFLEVDPSQTTKAKQYRKVLQRLCGDLEFRCSVRPLTEETMLAGFWDGNEVSSAECIRSFPVVPFLGHEWLSQLDHSKNNHIQVKPCRRRQVAMTGPAVYGWRGTDPRVYYLSPWEFTSLWEVRRLQPPQGVPEDLSVWLKGTPTEPEPATGWKFGEDYGWKQPVPATELEAWQQKGRD